MARILNDFVEHLIAVLSASPVVLALREEEAGFRCLGPGSFFAGGQLQLRLGALPGIARLDEGMHRGGLINPGVECSHVALAGSIALELAAQGSAIRLGHTGVQHILGVDGAIPATQTGAVRTFLDDEEI